MTVQQIVQQMVLAGVHFGHRKRHPKMVPYIYKQKDGLQILDLLQTYWYLQQACLFLFEACGRGQRVLFVGTKKHVAKCVEQTAKDCNSWYINKRWLGGFLTNWITLEKSIAKMQQQDSSPPKSKKEAARLERKRKRVLKYLGGVQTMSKLPDIVIIVDQQKEINAVRECQKLQIPSLTILDTNCDPTLTDLFIPGNDDSVTSVQFILNKLSTAIKEGQEHFNQFQTTRPGQSTRTIKARF